MIDDPNKNKKPLSTALDSDEWEFVPESTMKLEDSTQSKQLPKEPKATARKKPELSIEDTGIHKTRTRTELAAELYASNAEDKNNIDKTINLASHPKRAIALILDLFFLGFLYLFVTFSTPLFRALIKTFMDRYKRQFIFPEYVVMNALTIVVAFLTVFFCIVVPLAFFNRSFGKKMLGIKVRSEDRYNISLTQAFQREYVYKPLSILILFGFAIPFFNEKKQSLHDFLASTLVVDEKENKI